MTEKIGNQSFQAVLFVVCVDTVAVHDAVTFSSFEYRGVRITQWIENAGDADAMIAGMFDLLFDEVMAKKQEKINNQKIIA